MLGPNPKKAATPSTATSNSSTSSSDLSVCNGDGLMVKAINDIFKFVEGSENPQEFRVSEKSFIKPSITRKSPRALHFFIPQSNGKSLTTKIILRDSKHVKKRIKASRL